MLEHGQTVKPELVDQCFQVDKIATVREIMLFNKYRDFKKIVHNYVSRDELENDTELEEMFLECTGAENNAVRQQKKDSQE
jgi:hypothetical protein